VAELLTRGGTVQFFVNASAAGPSAVALTEDPQNPLDVWRWVILQRPFTRWLLFLLAPLVAYSIWIAAGVKLGRRGFQIADGITLSGLALLAALLTWAVLRSANPNYATFKMSGWIGPVLVVSAWAVVELLGGRLKQLLASGVLLLASYRAVGFLWWAAYLAVTNMPVQPAQTEWSLAFVTSAATCDLQIGQPSRSQLLLERAIAESGAPQRGCSVDGV
jgi:hypothetical protein